MDTQNDQLFTDKASHRRTKKAKQSTATAPITYNPLALLESLGTGGTLPTSGTGGGGEWRAPLTPPTPRPAVAAEALLPRPPLKFPNTGVEALFGSVRNPDPSEYGRRAFLGVEV